MARITNLEELIAEKYRLEAEVRVQKAIIKEGVQQLRRKLNPVQRLLDALGIGKDSGAPAPPLLKAGTNLGIEVIGHKLLRRAGWITRLVVPLLAKKVSSVFLDRFRKRKSSHIQHGDNVPHQEDTGRYRRT
jgi:hypothetical protein